MSLGDAEPSDGTDPMARRSNELSAETGALFVVAAGQRGGPRLASARPAPPTPR